MPDNDDPFQEFGGQQVAADPGDPFAEFGGQELKKKESSGLGALVGSVLGSGGLSTSKTKAHELGAVVGKSVSRPKSISHGIEQDKEATSTIGGIYNTIVGSVSRLAGGVGELMDWRDPLFGVAVNVLTGKPTREVASDFVDKARTSASSKESEKKLTSFNFADGVDWSDVGGVLASAPSQVLDIGLGVASGGGSFAVQAVNDAAKELEENPNAKDLTPMQKIGYVSVQAAVQTALDKLAISKIFKGTGIAKGVSKKITGEIVSDFAGKGIKATAAQIEKAAFQKVAALATKIKNVGIKAATGFAYEGGTEGLQQAGNDGIKLLTNKFKDKEIFDEQDIKQNFAKNVLNATAAGGIFGSMASGGAAALQNTNKAIRNEVANGADYEQVRQQIAEQVEQGNITPEEAKAADITAQQYAEIASKIPTEIDPEKKYAIIGGISQRESLSKEIELAKEEILKADPAFRREQLDKLDLLEAKLGQTNDYIEGLILDKKPEYKKEGDTYIKIDGNGQQTEISKEHFDLAEAVEQKVSRETSSVEQTITPIPIDEVETHESVLKRAKTGQSIEIEALRIQKSDKTNDNTGVFFADKGIIEEYRKREESGFYGEENKGLFSGDVKKHTLSFKNPLVVRNKFSWLQELAKNGDKEVQDVMPNYKDEYVFGTSHETYDALDTFVAKKARELGYDGIISPLEYIALDNKSFKPVNKPTPTKEELLGGESIVGDTSGVGNSVGNGDAADRFITNENGEPLTVYHSTFEEFDDFKDGITYFAEDADYSKKIADLMNRNGKASDHKEIRGMRTIPAKLKAERVYELPEGREMNGNLINHLIKDPEFLKKYDAVKGVDLYSDNKIVYAVFDKSKIQVLKNVAVDEKFINQNFESIASQLIMKNKIKRIC